MRLYLLRHGIAVPHGSPGIEDDDRPLTRAGRQSMRVVARGLKRLGLGLDAIVSSPLPRAKKTAEIVARRLRLEDRLEFSDALRAGVSADSVAEWLASRTESSLMLVGHNPSLSDLINRLVAPGVGAPLCELRKGGLAALRNDRDNRFEIDWIARPRQFYRA